VRGFMQVTENKMLGEVFGPTEDAVSGEFRTLRNSSLIQVDWRC